VFVTTRESDRVLEFSAASLVKQPSVAFRSSVQVGEAPVGLALVDHDRSLVVADSNRFGAAGDKANLAVVTIGRSGPLTLRGYLPSGAFPRDVAVSPDGKTLVVTNFGSGQVQTVDVRELP
jgi:DNA-binding beta-propeller fold protein YncE